eukprot:c3328_g1_i1.p1 GENE.c3328_g1_i1~~c3328_g1_i1.p1  ORF type:complete len:256 (+),score=30.94 c3328_g1_i1:554-1321(+)
MFACKCVANFAHCDSKIKRCFMDDYGILGKLHDLTLVTTQATTGLAALQAIVTCTRDDKREMELSTAALQDLVARVADLCQGDIKLLTKLATLSSELLLCKTHARETGLHLLCSKVYCHVARCGAEKIGAPTLSQSIPPLWSMPYASTAANEATNRVFKILEDSDLLSDWIQFFWLGTVNGQLEVPETFDTLASGGVAPAVINDLIKEHLETIEAHGVIPFILARFGRYVDPQFDNDFMDEEKVPLEFGFKRLFR